MITAMRITSLVTRTLKQSHPACRAAAGFAARGEGIASDAGALGRDDDIGARRSAPGGSARRQPPADELAGEAERLLRHDPEAMSSQGAREVQDFHLGQRGQRRAAVSELQGDGPAGRLESDVGKALEERAAQEGGGAQGVGRWEESGGGGGEAAGTEEDGWEQDISGGGAARDVRGDGDDAFGPAASDPATRFAPWGH
ncbi:hypothetical protein PLESTB_001712000 [Pleodorina starrii]|uniref:Uncharacterized protein n=1 Tax=Pleodorina starrii TaxID=330485 RepID=A0A9W6F962_9CHLO|nr:hypothetical protein PLESTB_001712000 [Pleodorina starrii]GLC75862.1 hypothetical protein PLESTF_001697500 [Pleodorina starrii]